MDVSSKGEVSQDEFKKSMQLMAGTVTIITSKGDADNRGMTATAVCSLTADPPSLIICINRSARTFDYIADSRQFCVNVLSEFQQPVADAFASSSGDSSAKFSIGSWTNSKSGVPMLDGSLINLVCEVEKWFVTKTHYVVVGMVEEIRCSSGQKPLLYFARRYTTIDAAPT